MGGVIFFEMDMMDMSNGFGNEETCIRDMTEWDTWDTWHIDIKHGGFSRGRGLNASLLEISTIENSTVV